METSVKKNRLSFENKTFRIVSALVLSVLSSFMIMLKLGEDVGALNRQGLVMTVVAAGLFALYYKCLGDKSGRYRGEYRISALFSVFFLIGDAVSANQTLAPIKSSPMQIIKSVCLLVTYFILTLVVTRVLHGFLEKPGKPLSLPWKFSRHPFVFFFVLILIFWIPHIIIRYPGTMCYDLDEQLGQVFGYIPITSNHPVTHTLFLGVCWKIGEALGSYNLGLFISVVIQSVMMAAIFAYTLVQMYRMKLPRWVPIVAFTVYAVTPNITGYIYIPLKDVPYSAFYVLYTSMLVDMVRSEEDFWHSKGRVAMFILSGAMIVLLRLNGILAVIPLSVWILIRILKNKNRAAVRIRRIAALLMTFVIIASANVAINLRFHPESGSIREPLSIFFQQTARVAKEFPDDATEDEIEAIDRVLDYKLIDDVYNPQRADAVKNTWREGADLSDLAAYLRAWGKQLLRHPLTYAEATIIQNYSLFYPQVTNIIYYTSVRTHHPMDSVMTATKNLHNVESFAALNKTLSGYNVTLHYLPVIGMLTSIAFWVLLMILLRRFARHHRMCGIGLISFPCLLTLLMCITSPVILYQSRYAFPLVYSMPVVLGAYVYLRRRQIDDADDKSLIETVHND